jgi:hypothetical protein
MPGPGGKFSPITSAMTRDPNFMIPFMQAIASGEAPGRYPLSQAQWEQAFDWYSKGSPQGPALSFNRILKPTAGGGGVVAQSAPVNLTMNAPVTINGVSGPPEAIGQRVGQAIQRSSALVLAELKRASSNEARLGSI